VVAAGEEEDGEVDVSDGIDTAHDTEEVDDDEGVSEFEAIEDEGAETTVADVAEGTVDEETAEWGEEATVVVAFIEVG